VIKPLTEAQITSLTSAATRYAQDIDDALPYLAARGITPGLAAQYRLGLVARPMPGHENFHGRLAIPYLTGLGVVDIRFRALDDSGAKYLNRPGATPTMYNVGALARGRTTVAVCEGELDAVMCDGAVGIPAVGVPGVNAWQPFWARLFADFDRVIIPCDGDDAGHMFGAKLAKVLDNAVVLHLPDGHDVSSLCLSQGVESVRERLDV
jgi:DNA primase